MGTGGNAAPARLSFKPYWKRCDWRGYPVQDRRTVTDLKRFYRHKAHVERLYLKRLRNELIFLLRGKGLTFVEIGEFFQINGLDIGNGLVLQPEYLKTVLRLTVMDGP